jgi:rhodanese-related sulfurtransferase
MKRPAFLTILAACLFVACSAHSYQSLGNDEFEQLIAVDSVQLIDVRTADEFVNKPHIASAVNIDVKSPDFDQRAQSLLDASKPVAVYCLHGKRSKIAAQRLIDLGFEQVYELNTGIEAWQNAGKAVE